MIRVQNNIFVLDTPATTYAFCVMSTGHLEHLYYGKRLTLRDPLTQERIAALREKHTFAPGNTCTYDGDHPELSLEDVRLEVSAPGRGDTREPFVELTYADGGTTSDFLFSYAKTGNEKPPYETLPGSYDASGKTQHLTVVLKEPTYGIRLELHYYVYEDCDVIARSARLVNEGKQAVQLQRLMSCQLDFAPGPLVMSVFTGAWAREMHRTDIPLQAGRYVSEACAGTSSSRANPFVMLGRPHTTEDQGDCYGIHLIYSGNHYQAAQVGSHGKIRFVSGIHPRNFSWRLEPGDAFEAPETAMTYSQDGYNGMSQHMHRFIRKHIVRGEWADRERPVLLNSWEAAYFQISEKKLLSLAKAGREAGIELFVMDDGWFGAREDDTSSLGDWEVNRKKLPGGLEGLCRRINEMGMDFGIWVEPEMVSVKSRLYAKHPEWSMEIPGHPHSEGRNQRVLDLGREEVQDYIIESMTKVFSSANITYVKWDMNRNMSDCYAQALPPARQGEAMHRYVMGLYRCMKTLTERFPHILFEGCAAGGNRFDPGILCYFPQIWASDNTDAVCRVEIQTGYSYGYPPSVIGAHVSACPNHQTLRITPLETRFHTAAFGILGYEWNFCDMKREELAAVRAQIELYKKWRSVLQFGDFYRGRTGLGAPSTALQREDASLTEWTCVASDKRRAVGFLMQKLAVPNTQLEYFRARGLDPDLEYHFYNRELKYSIKEFGDLVNTVSPVHIRQDSLAQDLLAKFVRMDGETEDCRCFGDVLMYAGVLLKQAFAATGYNDQIRYFPDFGSRMYFMEAEGE